MCQKLYLIIKGKRKEYLSKEMIEKYHRRSGMRTPFTGHELFTDADKSAQRRMKVERRTFR